MVSPGKTSNFIFLLLSKLDTMAETTTANRAFGENKPLKQVASNADEAHSKAAAKQLRIACGKAAACVANSGSSPPSHLTHDNSVVI